MADIIAKRLCAELDGEFVLFLIGARINKPWKVWQWLPVVQAMPRMLIELGKQPELGLLHARTHFGLRNVMVVQYWRSFDALEAYATSRNAAHLPAWQAFNKSVGSNAICQKTERGGIVYDGVVPESPQRFRRRLRDRAAPGRCHFPGKLDTGGDPRECSSAMAQQDVQPRKSLEHATRQQRRRSQRSFEREHRGGGEFFGAPNALKSRRMQWMDKDQKAEFLSARVKL